MMDALGKDMITKYRLLTVIGMRTKLENITKDSEKGKRHVEQECQVCWYNSYDSMVSQNFTYRDCEACGQEQTYSTGRSNALCKACAVGSDTCAHCGGDIDMRSRDNKRIQDRTQRAQSFIDDFTRRLAKFDADPQQTVRLSDHHCKVCFYLSGRVGGRAMTNKACDCCGTVVTYTSTITDKYCVPCSQDQGVCARCASDINLVRYDVKVVPKL